jgi:CRP-like cAMP-binding protein
MISLAETIAAIPMIRDMEDPVRTNVSQILADLSEPERVVAGTRLFTEGDDGDGHTGIILLDGQADVTHPDTTPKRICAPELLGEMMQFKDTAQRLATVTVATDATVLKFGWSDFVRRVMENPIISHSDQLTIREVFRKYAGARLHELESRPPSS